ncbi:metal binding domain of Ada-domain-containing protein [Xylaria venustula]|nr:metal binding domain of Ada-domain-containing protein [Xylaria venustula]
MTRSNTVAIPRNRTKSVHPGSSSTDETRWRLVLAHAPTSDFLYAVLSTKIFCRTSCPSRRPRRSNVVFFESARSAAAAGFRACRRCRPESTDSRHESPQAAAEKQVEVACEYVRQRKGEVQLLDVAAHVGLSPRYFHGLFKQILGTTPGAYAARIRSENSVATTPDVSVPDFTPLAVDLCNATNFAHLTSVDDGNPGTPFVDPQQTMYDWLPESFEDPSSINFGSAMFSEGLGDWDLDIAKFLGANSDVFEMGIETYFSDSTDLYNKGSHEELETDSFSIK